VYPTPELVRLLPEYPRTFHVPHKANAKRDDLVATLDDCAEIWVKNTSVQEKIDGSQVRMTIFDDEPVIGNRNHILNKGYSKARTASKLQYAPIWNWWYEHKNLFEELQEAGPYSVYGDWMYMQHGMVYDNLPSYFMTYDVFDYEKQKFLDIKKADTLLRNIGFSVVPLLHYGPIDEFEFLEKLANEKTEFAKDDLREGVYLKVCDGQYVINRFKMVREGFEQGKLLDQKIIKKNSLFKGVKK
jgi:ATP-dependent RNA circularization protein (DNA/RNA ligase family)